MPNSKQQGAKAEADKLKKKHSQIDESGAVMDPNDDGKKNPENRGNDAAKPRGDRKK